MHFDLRKPQVQFSGALPIASVTLCKLQKLSRVPFPYLYVLQSPQQGTRVLILDILTKHLFSVLFLVVAILIVMRWYLIVAFDLHFPDNQGSEASFHPFIDHLYIFFREMPVQVLCLIFNWLVCFSGVLCLENLILFWD